MNAEEKSELVRRCRRFVRRHGKIVGDFDPERRDAYIRDDVIVVETGEKGPDPHLRLMVRQPLAAQRWAIVFSKSNRSTKWSPGKALIDILEDLRQLMVLDDLADA